MFVSQAPAGAGRRAWRSARSSWSSACWPSTADVARVLARPRRGRHRRRAICPGIDVRADRGAGRASAAAIAALSGLYYAIAVLDRPDLPRGVPRRGHRRHAHDVRGARRVPRAAALLPRREHQVVEDRRRQPRLEQHAVDVLQREVAAVGVLPPRPRHRRRARRSPPARGWPSRTSWPAAPRRARGRRRSRRRAAKARELARGRRRGRRRTRSSRWFSAPPSRVARPAPGRARSSAPPQRRDRATPRAWARWRCGRRSATARRRRRRGRPGAARGGTRANACVEVGQVVQHRVAERRGRTTRPRTAAPRRRRRRVSTSRPSRCRVGAQRRRASPGRCRCRSPRAITPACSRFSEK